MANAPNRREEGIGCVMLVLLLAIIMLIGFAWKECEDKENGLGYHDVAHS